MSLKVFVDTNVFLDSYLERDEGTAKSIFDFEVFVLITDFENDSHLDEFAKLMRAVLDRVGERLRVVTIGGEKLANLKTNMGIHSYFNYFHRHSI